MITIGIELDHVVRNINKQIIKYYSKEFDPSADIDEIDDKTDILGTYAKFESKFKRNEFLYVDYPYEIYASSKPMDKNLPTQINNWLVEISNREDEEIRVIYYNPYEYALTIQSSFFFLSKIGTRVREVFFPEDINEIWEHCDVVITANKEVMESKPIGKQVVKVIGNGNQDDGSVADFEYDSLSSVIEDKEFIDKVLKGAKKGTITE